MTIIGMWDPQFSQRSWLLRNLWFHIMGRETLAELQAKMFHVKR